jgi:tetratricopeptide (TPR) repeat protein
MPQYRIGRIYRSQQNQGLMVQYYEAAKDADANFPPVFYDLYDYFSAKDIDRAKGYLEQYIQLADKDPETDFIMADYLYRAKRYDESIAKAKEIETAVGGSDKLPKLYILFALNYDKKGDSIQAKQNVQNYFTKEKQERILPFYYAFAGEVMGKFPGNETEAVSYLSKAIDYDTTVANKVEYALKAASILGKGQRFEEQSLWYEKAANFKPSWAELDHLRTTNSAYKAKNFVRTDTLAIKYIAAFPDKANGYTLRVLANKALDADTSKGLAIPALEQQNEYLKKDSVKYANQLYTNYYYMVLYYGGKGNNYPKAVEICDQMLAIKPGDEWATQVKASLTKSMNANAGKTPTGGTPK